ncbi:hypothetical protein [Geotalea sp. SG265]|uniref:hypothetical protein n=1 Tax=Geotalea sp. SG265 TaxID=2922867 RepID=UPI001FB0412E|nr:hypothetical protein [Geotalea sp. SG265]
MSKDKNDNRPQLRLVVNNTEKRNTRPAASEDDFISFQELVANREIFQVEFFRGLEPLQAEGYRVIERFITERGWPYGLDPRHGQVIVIPAGAICPESDEHGGAGQDEVLVYLAEDATGQGLCLALEMLMPYYSEDEAVMEDALLYGPVNQYGSLFLEENRHDSFLDLIYRLSFPVYPVNPDQILLNRFFSIAAFELKETLQGLAGYSYE